MKRSNRPNCTHRSIAESGFSPALLAHVLFNELGIDPRTPIKVAFSGGLDSQALLHALTCLTEQYALAVTAVYVDHGLQPDTRAWAERCRRTVLGYGIPFVHKPVQVRRQPRESLEAAARTARYACLREAMDPGDLLLTGHHQNDQAETLLLMLLRGSGVPGLAAMAPVTRFGQGRLARPLLGFSRRQLHAYARSTSLQWIEDTSNADRQFARNFLRHDVLPQLQSYWPGAAEVIARSAEHCREALSLLDEVAAADLAACRSDYRGVVAYGTETLSAGCVRDLGAARARNVLRYWIRHNGFGMPPSRRLERIMADLVAPEAPSGDAVVRWTGTELRRYRDHLFLMSPCPRPGVDEQMTWDLAGGPLAAPSAGLRLIARQGPGGIDIRRLDPARVTIGWRQGGESCALPGRSHHHRLKKLFQAHGVPPWERARLPLLYAGERLVGVAGLWVFAPFAAGPGARGVNVAVEAMAPLATTG